MLNIIANPSFKVSGADADASTITPELLESTLHEADENEANVATGYHAIEFLLWGQDANGFEHGAGNRSWTDYAAGDACTNGNCDRRAQYLKAATDLLVSDLEWMTAQWAQGGDARAAITGAEAGFSYDQMLAPGSEAGAALINGGVDALVMQTRSIERVTAVLGLDKIGVEGSDSLDNPKAVFE